MSLMHDVEKIREEIMTRPNTGYCNILSNEVYRIIYGDKKEKEEIPLQEEEMGHMKYDEYVIYRIEKEIETNGVAFIELKNSIGEEKTFIHEFVLFASDKGIVRMESYGKGEIYERKNGRTRRLKGYILYHPRIVEWLTWTLDIKHLLKVNPGKERLSYWNNMFSAIEDQDTNEIIDVIMY